MTRELLKAHIAALINESMAVRKTTMIDYGMSAGLGHSAISNYARGKVLPSTRSWAKLMAIFCELPDLRGEIAQANLEERQKSCARMVSRRARAENYDSVQYHDIAPEERDVVVTRVFGCPARQVPGYDQISTYVLMQLKAMSASELRQNRMQVLVRLFAEARHAVGC